MASVCLTQALSRTEILMVGSCILDCSTCFFCKKINEATKVTCAESWLFRTASHLQGGSCLCLCSGASNHRLGEVLEGFRWQLRCYLRCTLQGRIGRSKSQLYTQAWQPKLKHNRQWGDEMHIPCEICISPTQNKHAINKQTGPGPKANNHHSRVHWHAMPNENRQI